MQFQVGDRFTDEAGEWEIIGRPSWVIGSKLVHARVRNLHDSTVGEERTWNAHGRITVTRVERPEPTQYE